MIRGGDFFKARSIQKCFRRVVYVVNWAGDWVAVAAIQLGRLLEIEFDAGGYWSCDESGNFGVVGELFGRPAFVLVTGIKISTTACYHSTSNHCAMNKLSIEVIILKSQNNQVDQLNHAVKSQFQLCKRQQVNPRCRKQCLVISTEIHHVTFDLTHRYWQSHMKKKINHISTHIKLNTKTNPHHGVRQRDNRKIHN